MAPFNVPLRGFAQEHPLLTELLSSGVSVSCANVVTLPMDVMKVRMQLQKAKGDGTGKMPGVIRSVASVVRTEGISALYSGLSPAVARGLTYGGVRLGLYGPVKGLYGVSKERPSMLWSIAAGCTSGAIAAAVSNPIDLIKTRLQARGGRSLTSLQVVQTVVASEGVLGLWRGTVPSMVRAAALTASQCATYDVCKQQWMELTGWSDNLPTHLGASMATGLVTTTVTAPVDVIKTNMFVGGTKYSGPLSCAADLVRKEGPRALVKGWTIQYIRLGPQTVVTFLVLEQVRHVLGLSSF
eukprot:jgi/Botrbrau1/4985/Bobra.0396s0012.2